MAIEYVIDYPCKIKQKWGTWRMVSAIKGRNAALAVLKTQAKEGKSEKEAMATCLSVMVQNPEGDKARDSSVQEILEMTEPLVEDKKECENCKVSQRAYFGCYHSIRYPISAKAEEYLIDLVKIATNKGSSRAAIMELIPNHSITGEIFEKIRGLINPENGQPTFFELKKALEVKVKDRNDKVGVINTNQLFELFFRFSPLKPTSFMLVLAKFSDMVTIQKEKPEQKENKAFARVDSNKLGESWLVFTPRSDENDDSSIKGLKTYFYDLFLAYVLQKDILINF